MVGFQYTTKLTLDQSYLRGITDLKIGPNGILYAGSEHTDGVTTWSLGDGTVAQHVASLEFAPVGGHKRTERYRGDDNQGTDGTDSFRAV